MSKYQAYPEYKDSGVEWLGDIPALWKVSSISSLSTKITNGYVGPTRDIFFESGVRYLQSLHIKKNTINFHTPYYVSKAWSNEKSKSILNEGDVLVVQTGDIGQVAAVPQEFVGCNCHALIIISTTNQLNGFYLSWLLNSDYGYHSLKSIQTGALHPHLNCEAVKTVKTPIPEILEQTKIAAFLDHETAKIDTLIEKQQQLIELLKEKRQAVISHAVTKGLNPDAPMKDSGVEWLGEVPEHWGVVKLSYKLKLLSGDGITSLEIEPEGEFPVFGGNGLRGYCSKYNCEGDYVLIGRQGALCGNINIATGQFFASEHAVVVYPHEQFDITFLSEFLRFMNLGQYSVSAAQPGISVERVNNLKIAVPPLNEQKEIGRYIDKYSKEYDALSKLAQKQVDLLKERRTALISAAVTGKIDVRHWVAPTTSIDTNEAQQEVTA